MQLVTLVTVSATVSLALAAAVNAKSRPDTALRARASSGIDTCVIDCAESAVADSDCTSFTDLSCVCTSTAYQEAVEECLKANCTAADYQTALELQAEECGAYTTTSATSTSTSTSSTVSSTVVPSSVYSSAPVTTSSTSTPINSLSVALPSHLVFILLPRLRLPLRLTTQPLPPPPVLCFFLNGSYRDCNCYCDCYYDRYYDCYHDCPYVHGNSVDRVLYCFFYSYHDPLDLQCDEYFVECCVDRNMWF
ncbi:hypothetical protein FISHEDRAFT_61188 [Fistulina hepatica ATCC 64428]|uniref:CFEM domain-containing protein n=1 Tax=Fistulina hepatica ATCC 64428 TaxID=1128425 RepID=A0A0D7A3U7_9AGAR|nr:hypothetical protein FISHEDRAFT_61188 [Fistulina hepatica ATCC 64428]